MTANSQSPQPDTSPSTVKTERLKTGLAISQTAYELNNGHRISVGNKLEYLEDSALNKASGAKPLKLSIDESFEVRGVFNEVNTGLNAFLAYSKDRKEILIGVAGTNGFGADAADTKQDLIGLGVGQAKSLVNDDKFQSVIHSIVKSENNPEAINILIAGQSLGGGIAPNLGMFLVYGDPSKRDDLFYSSLGIKPAQISVVSVNGFGNEYAAKFAGFSQQQISDFNTQADLNRIVVFNKITGKFDLVSQFGGSFSGTNWILDVELSRSLAELHRMNFGVAEGFNNLYGDLTRMRSGQVPVVNHKTLAENAFQLDSMLPIANNALSLSLASYVSLLFSKPGEGAASLSAGLQSYVGLPKSFADVIGAVGEFVLRALPVAQATQVLQFLLGGYVGGQLIGSKESTLPAFDFAGTFGPIQEGWTRKEHIEASTVRPVFVIDTNPATRVSVIKEIDGRSVEIHPDGTQIQTHPEFGTAVIQADGSGMLFLKNTDKDSGELLTSTVVLEAGTKLNLNEGGWITQRLIDKATNLYEVAQYSGVTAKILEAQVETSTNESQTKLRTTKTLITDLPANNLALPDSPSLMESTIAIGPGHVRRVLRDDDRRTVQMIDIFNTNQGIESTYKDGQGNVQQVIKEERLNVDTVRTTTIDGAGNNQDVTTVRRYRRNGELFELEDRTDNEGVRIIIVRDSDGNIKKAGRVPLDVTPSEYYAETVLDDLHSDVADFLTALRQKDTAGIILSTARIALDYARSQGVATLPFDTAVADASSGLALISSLRSLRSGDTVAKISGTVGLLNSTNYFAARLTGSGYLTGAQSAALSQLGAVLAIYNLSNLGKMVESGQIGSAGATLIGAINAGAYLAGASSALMGSGALIAINPIVMVGVAILADAVLAEDPPPPPPQGTVSFYRDDNGQLAYQLANHNKLGVTILDRNLAELMPALRQRLDTVNQGIVDDQHKLVLVASRMPTIQIAGWPVYADNGVDNYFFVLKQQDPMRDDPGYVALSRKDLVKLYSETLLLPEAIVQQWEIDHLQKKFGSDETHWQTEGEWLRGRSPIVRERSQLQHTADLAQTRWEALSKLHLSPIFGSNLGNGRASVTTGNVVIQTTLGDKLEALRQAMAAAKVAVDAFNELHPVDPRQARLATPEQNAAFAQASGAREAVALQWTKLVVVDLGNDGVQMIDLPGEVGSDLNSLRTQHVARFDVDGDGYREATQWISPTDAILGIDRSGNSILDSGSELFNGADTPLDQQGIASLAFYDANGDGLITRDDPVYQQLRLWVDIDGDGSSGALEVFDLQMRTVAMPHGENVNTDLASMAVDAIDLTTSTLRFADGSTSALKQMDLLAHTQGLQIVSDTATGNLNVLHESDLRENFVTLVDDMSALQELSLPELSAARRSQLEALARQYGLNPASPEFASIVQSLRSAGSALGKQETVIYFGDDNVWVDASVRERLEQARISFRKLNEPGSLGAASPHLVHIGRAASAERLAGDGAFDDRWVPSRRVGSADIRSDAAVTPATPEPSEESRPLPTNVYSLLSVTKGAQAGDLVRRQAVIGSDNAKADSPDAASSFVFSTAQPVATLGALAVDADEDSAVSVSYERLVQAGEHVLSANGTDARLQLIGIRSASHGTVAMDDQANRVGFRPQADLAGEASFTYVLADAQGQIYEQQVKIRLKPVNDAPRVAGESIDADEDVPLLIDPLALLANDHDVDGDRLHLTGIARVALGRAELLGNGQIHYTPPSDQYDVVDTLDYIVQDSQGASAVARIQIHLRAADDAPSVVTERVIHAREDQQLRISSQLLLRNDFDVDTDARTGSLPLKITAVGSAEHGSVRLDADGEIVFRPAANFNGEASFSYTVMDDSGLATTGHALVKIDPANDAPLAAGEQIASREDEPLIIDTALLLKNELDIDIERGEAQTLTIVAVDAAVGGKVALNNGLISFTPDANRSGRASFGYTVSDGAGGFDRATVEIDLAEVNDAPVVPSLHINTLEDTELVLPVSTLLKDATDVDGESAALRLVSVGRAIGGSVTLADGQVRFRPEANFSGAGSVDFVVADEHGAETTGIVAIDVNDVNDAPVRMPGSRLDLNGLEDQEFRIAESALVKMYWDAEGDPIRLDPQSPTALNPGDLIRFDASKRELVLQAAPNANGLRQFSVAMTDGKLTSAAQTLAVNLRAVNDAPVVNAVGFQMLEDGGETDPTKSAWTYVSHELLLSGASDTDGDVLKIVGVANARTTGVARPKAAEVVNDPANSRIGLRAPLNYVGAIDFDFTVEDADGAATTQKAYGSVVAVNDAPHMTIQQIGKTVMVGRSTGENSTWQIEAWDPEAGQDIKLAIERNPLRGNIKLGKPSSMPDGGGGIYTKVIVSAFSGYGNVITTESASFSATDSTGTKSLINLSLNGRYFNDPIVIDFGRDGFSFIDIAHSAVRFDIDGELRRSAWIGAGEGILAYDADRDGRVDGLDEIAFGSHIGQPTLSDLQALQNVAFDRNQDAVFDAQDPAWQQFLVWRDLNGNGVSDAGELQSLTDAGIRGLYLNANVLNRAEGANVRVRGYTRVLMNDGSLLQAADVWLGQEAPDVELASTPEPSMQQATQLGADQLANLLKQIADAPREGNRAPMVYGYLPTQFADAGQPFRLELAPNFFIDLDTLDPVTIDARLADGSALPAWLRWDPVRLRLDGRPTASDEGALDLAFIATDRQGASARTTFALVIDASATSTLTATTTKGPADVATPVDDGLQPIDLALSRLLSAIAAGTADTSAAGSFEMAASALPVDGIDLLAGFRPPASSVPSEPAFGQPPLAAADPGPAWHAAAATMATAAALPSWAAPDTASPWRPQSAPAAFA